MDKRDWYYRQLVTESDLDESFDWAETADRAQNEDFGIVGAFSGLGVTPNAPADLNVLVAAGVGCDKDGKRLYISSQQIVDCSEDVYGASTSVSGGSNEKFISIFLGFDQVLSTPETDGNGLSVYTEITESFELYVLQGTETAIGAATPPALQSDAILLADVRLINAQTQIVAADIDVNEDVTFTFSIRREDWYRDDLTNLGETGYGTSRDAVAALFTLVDGLSSGGGVSFSASGNWHDASGLSSTDVEAAINEIVSDLTADAGSDRVGSAAISGTPGGYADQAAGSVFDQLGGIATDVAGHINGGAPAHTAAAVTSASVGGAPESHTGSNVQTAISELFGHVNARTERSTDETIDAAWIFDNGTSDLEDDQIDFKDSPRFRTLIGGSAAPATSDADLAGKNVVTTTGWAWPFSNQNDANMSSTLELVDVCVGFVDGARRILALSASNNQIAVIDPTDMHVDSTSGSNLASGLPAPQVSQWNPTAMCCDGTYVYVMFEGDHATPGSRTHYIQAYALTDWSVRSGWAATGTVLPGASPTTGVYGGSETMTDRCIMVPGQAKVATLNSWVPVANSNSPVVSVIDATDGSVDGYGAGDVSNTGASVYASGGLASDGTNIFFSTYDTTPGNGELATCTVASPSTGSSINDFPKAISSDYCQELIFDHDCLWALIFGTSTARGAIWFHDCDSSSGAWLTFQDSSGTDTAAIRWGAFDGLNIWVLIQDETSGGGEHVALGRFPVGRVQYENNTSDGLTKLIDGRFKITRKSEVNDVSAENFGRICFDGDGIVVCCDSRGSQSLSGQVRKLPRAGMR